MYQITREGITVASTRVFRSRIVKSWAQHTSITLSVLTINYSLPPTAKRISKCCFTGKEGGRDKAVICNPPLQVHSPLVEASHGFQMDRTHPGHEHVFEIKGP